MIGTHIDQAITDKMVERAIAECAEVHFAGNTQRLSQALLQGQCEYCKCVSDSLVRQIGDFLGQVDKSVKVVYQYEPVSTPHESQDEESGFLNQNTGINLVVWVEQKSAAWSVLAEALEAVLSSSQRKIGCVKATPGCFTLDVKMVDDQDIQERRGYGLLADSTYLHSKLVWKRSARPLPVSVKKVAEPVQVRFTLPDSFDPELIPESRLMEHASAIEGVPPENRMALEHHLTQLKVVLIRRIISDQLAYINIAKRWFTVADLANIYRRRIGYGKIGGKAAGMLLAARILDEVADDDIRSCLQIPESYFLGSDLIYIFMAMNGLMYWNDQKYKSGDQIWAEYPQIQQEFQAGSFPPEILVELKEILANIGNKPLIVRSSSQLEDNFGTTFAGKYDSFFCPNQGTAEENLAALTNAIARTYASTLKPEALLYRRSKGLQDYDERMAVLIQAVQGERFGKYYLPHGSGVAFSHNLYRWSPQIRREDGFARLVWGLGTRAVQRLGDDYPRLVALSHPTLQPDDSTEAIRHYSQRYVDLIDLEDNAVKTLPVHEVLSPGYPPLRLVAQVEQDGFFVSPRMRVKVDEVPKLVITYHEFLNQTAFAASLSRILRLLEQHYHSSVDVEFTIHLPTPNMLKPPIEISLLQCRPQSHLQDISPVPLPEDLPAEDILFSTHFMIPRGHLPDILYVLFVKPETYFSLPTPAARHQVSQVIARLNSLLGNKSFICVGPGRWGATNLDLGVYVSYADIHNAGALVELSGKGIGPAPEPSLGTHFFQDLMEAQIYPLAVPLDDEGVRFHREFFYRAPNSIQKFLDVDEAIEGCIRLIDVDAYRPGYHLELVMDDERGEAVAFLAD